MKIVGKIRVRFANKEDITWCVTQDNLVAEEVIKCKIELNEVIISEIAGRILATCVWNTCGQRFRISALYWFKKNIRVRELVELYWDSLKNSLAAKDTKYS